MKWRIKKAGNDRCIVSDCGDYTISRYTCGGIDVCETYFRGDDIGSAETGNKARRIADRHKADQEKAA